MASTRITNAYSTPCCRCLTNFTPTSDAIYMLLTLQKSVIMSVIVYPQEWGLGPQRLSRHVKSLANYTHHTTWQRISYSDSHKTASTPLASFPATQIESKTSLSLSPSTLSSQLHSPLFLLPKVRTPLWPNTTQCNKYDGVKVRIHAFVTLILDVTGQHHDPDNVTRKKRTRYMFDRKPGVPTVVMGDLNRKMLPCW